MATMALKIIPYTNISLFCVTYNLYNCIVLYNCVVRTHYSTCMWVGVGCARNVVLLYYPHSVGIWCAGVQGVTPWCMRYVTISFSLGQARL